MHVDPVPTLICHWIKRNLFISTENENHLKLQTSFLMTAVTTQFRWPLYTARAFSLEKVPVLDWLYFLQGND
jgi:hypothetical protein